MFLFVTVPNNSGSTMITRILSTSPNVSCLTKSIWFDRPTPPNRSSPDLEGKDVRLADLSDYVANYMPKGEPRIFSEQADSYVEENFNWPMIKKFWLTSWNMLKSVQVEKTPDNVFKAPFLAEEFPESKFIIATRSAEAFCASMEKFGFTAERSYKHWTVCQEQQERNIKLLGDRCYVTTYEEICQDPQKFLKDLVEFVPELGSLKFYELIESRNKPCAAFKVLHTERILKEWINQQGHNRCWYYPDLFEKLIELYGIEADLPPNLPPLEEFRAGCMRYQDSEYCLGENHE